MTNPRNPRGEDGKKASIWKPSEQTESYSDLFVPQLMGQFNVPLIFRIDGSMDRMLNIIINSDRFPAFRTKQDVARSALYWFLRDLASAVEGSVNVDDDLATFERKVAAARRLADTSNVSIYVKPVMQGIANLWRAGDTDTAIKLFNEAWEEVEQLWKGRPYLIQYARQQMDRWTGCQGLDVAAQLARNNAAAEKEKGKPRLVKGGKK